MTVRIEYMIVDLAGYVVSNWSACEGSLHNDPQTYVPRGYSAKTRFSRPNRPARIRVVDEQTGRIVDMIS
jgi:hypothetical protein